MAMTRWHVLTGTSVLWLVAISMQPPVAADTRAADPHSSVAFATSDNCLACHNGLIAANGEDVSIGVAWRASMMANSSRDPYWQASVRRETIDHKTHGAAIQDECAICHMPMARARAHAEGGRGEVFALAPSNRPSSSLKGGGDPETQRLAADGVSCTLCHQIGPDRLGSRDSFVGAFALVAPAVPGGLQIFGPYDVDAGLTRTMNSATGATPSKAEHLRKSELCATCHTLYTEAFGPNGEVIGSLPEQMPFLEWRHSAFAREPVTLVAPKPDGEGGPKPNGETGRTCQSCHMPDANSAPIASVLGEPRERLARHTFLGGNFFMLRMLNRFRTALGVMAPAPELDSAAQATLRQLGSETAAVDIARTSVIDGRLEADVVVRNLTGHKLPTGYPSRRVWVHLTVRDADGATVFESGAVDASGRVAGNDNDADARRFEPHYDEIRTAEQVQIYEAVIAGPDGALTTGLLTATQYVKDNRLLPRGFDKATAEADIAVHGDAARDASFTDAGDRIRYNVAVKGAGPLTVEAELRYQPIGFRWADNLRGYEAAEPRRFVSYYDAMAASSSTLLARASATVR
jgi:hypothetical protein